MRMDVCRKESEVCLIFGSRVRDYMYVIWVTSLSLSILFPTYSLFIYFSFYVVPLLFSNFFFFFFFFDSLFIFSPFILISYRNESEVCLIFGPRARYYIYIIWVASLSLSILLFVYSLFNCFSFHLIPLLFFFSPYFSFFILFLFPFLPFLSAGKKGAPSQRK